jgi:hypothetical protein
MSISKSGETDTWKAARHYACSDGFSLKRGWGGGGEDMAVLIAIAGNQPGIKRHFLSG